MVYEELVSAYKKTNTGKKQKLIYHLTERGYASEINYMLSAMLYCLIHDIEFCLCTRFWNGAYKKGWQDYFSPFCREYNSLFFFRGSVFEMDPPRGSRRRRLYSLQKFFFPNYLYHHDIWDEISSEKFSNRHFSIPELDIDGDMFSAKQVLLKMIYNYNSEIQNFLDEKSRLLEDIKPYIAVSIRRGDKVALDTKEADLIEAKDYVDRIKEIDADASSIFIATDDYEAVKEFQNCCPPEWKIKTFCPPEKKGFNLIDFNCEEKNNIKNEMIELFADIHYLLQSETFIGTYSSNIGRLVALLRGGKRSYSMDDKWHGL